MTINRERKVTLHCSLEAAKAIFRKVVDSASSGEIPIDSQKSWLPMISVLLAIVMTTMASIVARRSYLEVLRDVKAEEGDGKPKGLFEKETESEDTRMLMAPSEDEESDDELV